MKRSMLEPTIVGVAVALASGSAVAQAKIDLGKREYDSNCASCHGTRGKGDGPYRPFLTTSPSDLTVLAKKNGGVLPVWDLQEVIDGRRDVRAHGRDMPIWGADYRAKAGEYFVDYPQPYDPEVAVRMRILALIDYIGRLQVK
jgi:mono/diheme cytochrome c family protein